MAGDWVKLEHTTPDKPEVVQLARSLGIDRDVAVGKLIRIWIWADQNAIDGYAKGVDAAFVDELARMKSFAKKLEKTGWIRIRKGGVFFPNFDRHNGNSAKQRALAARRMQKTRCAASVTKPSPEKRREEKKQPINKGVPMPEIPRYLKAIWPDWVETRKAMEKPLTPKAAEMQLKKLAEVDEAAAIQIIEYSIMNNYQGLIFDRRSLKGGSDDRRPKTKPGRYDEPEPPKR